MMRTAHSAFTRFNWFARRGASSFTELELCCCSLCLLACFIWPSAGKTCRSLSSRARFAILAIPSRNSRPGGAAINRRLFANGGVVAKWRRANWKKRIKTICLVHRGDQSGSVRLILASFIILFKFNHLILLFSARSNRSKVARHRKKRLVYLHIYWKRPNEKGKQMPRASGCSFIKIIWKKYFE